MRASACACLVAAVALVAGSGTAATAASSPARAHAADPRDSGGRLDLKTVSAVARDGVLTLRLTTYGAWSSRILRGTRGTAGPAPGRNRLVVLYDTNGDGRPDYTGRIVFWQGHLALWITGHGRALEPVPVRRPNGQTASFAHAVDALFPAGQGRKTLGIAVESVDRQARDCSPVCRDRAPNRGWIRVG